MYGVVEVCVKEGEDIFFNNFYDCYWVFCFECCVVDRDVYDR